MQHSRVKTSPRGVAAEKANHDNSAHWNKRHIIKNFGRIYAGTLRPEDLDCQGIDCEGNIFWSYHPIRSCQGNAYNKKLQAKMKNSSLECIDNSNIDISMLGRKQHHLNGKGIRQLAVNIIKTMQNLD